MDPPPEPSSAIYVRITNMWMSKTETAAEKQTELEILVKRLAYLNSPQGQQIFEVLEQHIQDWTLVVEDLTRFDGRFARIKQMALPPSMADELRLFQAGSGAISKARKAFDRYAALVELAVTVEAICTKAERFNRELRTDFKNQKCDPIPVTGNPAANSPSGGNQPSSC